MNSYSIQIVKLIQQGERAGTMQGLMQGNVGLCLFFYHLAQSENNAEYEDLADNLLDKVFDNLSTSTFADFENGLSGIGWGIEYLVQNGFAEGDTDKILEEVDNKVFKALHDENLISFELGNGLTGYLFYLINRLKKPTNARSLAQRINRELLILVINKLDEVVTTQFPSITKEMNFDLFWRFPVVIFGLVESYDLGIYNEKIKNMIYQWIMNFEAYLPSMHIYRLYLATVLSIVNSRLPNERLEKQIQILLFATDFEVLKAEVDPDAMNIRFGWPGFAWLLQQASQFIPTTYLNHGMIDLSRREIITKYKYSLRNRPIDNLVANPKQYGLSEGATGIGLMELLYSEIFHL